MSEEFLEKYNGTLRGILRWEKLDDLWSAVREQKHEGWHVYAIGHELPEKLAGSEELDHFIEHMDTLLRNEHDKDYCGIVYTDDFTKPSLVKIFNPSNLGSSCGASNTSPQPGWIISRDKPVPLGTDVVLAGNRKRWWNRLWD